MQIAPEMKKAIWIFFVTVMLIWTGFAVLAAGLARWTSDAIASERLAQTTESVTQKLADATGSVTQQVETAVRQVVDVSTGLPATLNTPSAVVPPLPPLPDWVNLLLDPEMVQSIKDWGVWAMHVAHAGKDALNDTAEPSSETVAQPLIAEQNPNLLNSVTRSETESAGKPWLADLIGWLVPIVWVIWGIGFILFLSLTIIAQKLIHRFLGKLDDQAMAAA